MPPTYTEVHPRFRFNGHFFSYTDLKEVAYSLVKEGNPYEKDIGEFLLAWTDNNSTVEVRTSGSTGNPKAIVLEKQHMVHSALATGEFFRLQPGDSALLCVSANYIAGKMMLVRAMVLGLQLDAVEVVSNPLSQISAKYDFCAMVPLQLKESIQEIERISKLIVGGAPVPFELKKRVSVKKTRVYETYGMTETITHIAARQINHLETKESLEKNDIPFATLPNVKIKVDDRECLRIDAPAIGVHDLQTNDRIRLVAENQFEWLGRYDNVINSGGIKLFPESIEAKLGTIIPNRFFVVGLPDKTLGTRMVLIVEGTMDESELWSKIKTLRSLGRFEIPKAIYALPSFLETETGKIQRKQTLKLLKEGFE